jgi:hypothetical protein
MEFVHELYSRKEAYERELILAKAKVDVITDIIADLEAKNATRCEAEVATEEVTVDNELADFIVPKTTETDESY